MAWGATPGRAPGIREPLGAQVHVSLPGAPAQSVGVSRRTLAELAFGSLFPVQYNAGVVAIAL